MPHMRRRTLLELFAAVHLAVIGSRAAFGQDAQTGVVPVEPAVEGRNAEVSTGFAPTAGKTLGPRKFVNSPSVVRVRPGQSIDGYKVQDIAMDGCGRLIDCAGFDKRGRVSNVSNLTVARIRSVNARAVGLIRLRGASNDVIIRDVFYQSAALNVEKGKVYGVVLLQGKSSLDVGKRILIENVYGEGVRSSYKGFKNGDIFADESGWSEVVYRRCHGKYASDSIFDLKSSHTVLDNCTAEEGRRNFKLWYDKHSTRLTSINPGRAGSGEPAHYFAKGSQAQLCTQVIEHIDFVSDNQTPLIVAEGHPVRIVVKSYTCNVPAGTPIVGGKASLARITWETGPPRL